MLVYRFETEGGGGPYYGSESGLFSSCYHNSEHPLPGPAYEAEELKDFWVENKGGWDNSSKIKHWKCAFTSLDQLFAWFPRHMLAQAAIKDEDRGLGISAYEVDPSFVKRGKYQCIFDTLQAVRVDRVPPDGYNHRELEGIPELCSLILPIS